MIYKIYADNKLVATEYTLTSASRYLRTHHRDVRGTSVKVIRRDAIQNPAHLDNQYKIYNKGNITIEWANEIIRLSIKAEKEGIGVSVTGDKFVGPPMVKMAKEILNKSSLITQTEE